MYTLLVLIFITKTPLLTLESELGPYIRAYLVISAFLSLHGTRSQDRVTAEEEIAVVIRDVTIPVGAAENVYYPENYKTIIYEKKKLY